MNGLTEEQLLLRNLKDAGCSEADIERYLKLRAEGKALEQSRFLSAHRVKLLEQIHESQEKLDCPVNSRKTDLRIVLLYQLKDILRGHVLISVLRKHLQDKEPLIGHLQALFLQHLFEFFLAYRHSTLPFYLDILEQFFEYLRHSGKLCVILYDLVNAFCIFCL